MIIELESSLSLDAYPCENNLTLIENLQARTCTPHNVFRLMLLDLEWTLRPLPTTVHNLTLIIGLS